MSDLTNTFTAIANAIRTKTGGSNSMTPSQMTNEILNIPSGGGTLNVLKFESDTKMASANVNFGVDAKYVLLAFPLAQNNNSLLSVGQYIKAVFVDIENSQATFLGYTLTDYTKDSNNFFTNSLHASADTPFTYSGNLSNSGRLRYYYNKTIYGTAAYVQSDGTFSATLTKNSYSYTCSGTFPGTYSDPVAATFSGYDIYVFY